MIYLQLFYTFFIIGIFTFGGGYAMLSLIQNEVVVKHAWLTAERFTDIVAISQMTPGPIGINSATYIGYSVTGNVFGSIIATFAVVIPSFIIVLTICRFYMRFKSNTLFTSLMKIIRPVVIGMITAAAGILVTKENFFDWTSWAIFALSFFCCHNLKTNPILIIIAGGLLGLIIY